MNKSKSEKCFAESDKGKCVILTVKQCQGHENCSFFKTEEQARLDQQKAFERIATLPLVKQEYIAGTHYNNKMPWHQMKKAE